MKIPAELRYVASHEWCRVEGDEAVIGITDFAQDQLGDVVYIELPNVGDTIADTSVACGTIESVKAASDLYSPVTGTVIAVTEALEDSVELVNQDPYGAGWMIRVKLADLAELDSLLDAAGYAAAVEAEG